MNFLFTLLLIGVYALLFIGAVVVLIVLINKKIKAERNEDFERRNN